MITETVSAPFTFPEDIAEALVNHDRRLRCVWNMVKHRWEVWYLRRTTGLPNHPTALTHMRHNGMDPRYTLVRAMVDSEGNPRKPVWGDYDQLRMCDTHNVRPRDVVAAAMAEQRREENKYDSLSQAAQDCAIQDLANAAAGRIVTGYGD